ncbi:arylamine N-acetyltransferase [Streptomyces sp. TBY4]|uniref:arylamine N-acetyltransferase family protein n=1 Tax=Streptomyces sp. TBY4 TaxID=2962030 RepID=UPI0020B8F8CF|nr:arylamine N-acetyltransferase [Streptomyces sp. TBY4]MCP3755174.1 arylamine N-acetyltransferase [Streptomyces sp. TBY4]
MLNDAQVDAYLDRIGATRPERADLAALRLLQERHCLTVPFENLDYHFPGTAVHMDEQVLEKLVDRRRGGGCYEVNPAFGYLLSALGYQVEILPGQVYRPDGPGPFMGHLALRVLLDGEAWLVDVGFGRNSRTPLRFATDEPQQDVHGSYRVVASEGEGAWGFDVLLNDRPLYRIDDRPVRVADFVPTLWWWRTAPESPFLADVFCSLPTEDGGRITLKGNRLTQITGSERIVEDLEGDEAVLAAYRKYFGFDLDALPATPEPGRAGIQTG